MRNLGGVLGAVERGKFTVRCRALIGQDKVSRLPIGQEGESGSRRLLQPEIFRIVITKKMSKYE